MGQHILKVWKDINKEEEKITFYIYERLDEPVEYRGGLLHYLHVENFERLRPLEKKKTGYFNIQNLTENEWEIFFEIEKESVPSIMEIAVALTKEFPKDYSLQYDEFLKRLSEQGIIRR